jgi:hypothetical protein
MEKRSRRRIRDLVALAAFQGLSQNEIGCARISMMAGSTSAPFKGRIQKRKTNHLQIFTFGLQRTAGPYKGAKKATFITLASCWTHDTNVCQIALKFNVNPSRASGRVRSARR